ncbi:DUF4244 domain-containing protein [Prauserella muralis]|uniref:DUF4244 domain-containing protein n=1 Tax=Prauserella muralis TaxID=588067 RepID=A0A2V4BPX0_9PSEU|nr:DUF4244 domain-containing protein [Prauserella muralis]PXY32653.1 DUF4244 domain-containing protein [Prauserella muralis]
MLTRAVLLVRPSRDDDGDADAGMSTAEYAIGTIAAAAFAAVLYAVVTGDSILSGLTSLVERAISVDF